MSKKMIDSLGSQLREAETRRADIEHAHHETLAQIQSLTNNGNTDSELFENLHSRARELEKKAALETVHCEELQLELSTALKSYTSRSTVGASTTSTTTSSTVTWAPTVSDDQGTEIDIIMAKIEQDNRVLAELDHTRTSGPTMSTMPPNSILSTGKSEFKSISKNVISGTTSTLTGYGIYQPISSVGAGALPTFVSKPIGIPTSLSNQAIQSKTTSAYVGQSSVDKVLGGTSGLHIPSFPINLNTMKNLPAFSQRGTIQLYKLQSTAMPILSLHNSHNVPTGSANYTLGLNGAPVVSSYIHPSVSNVMDTTSIIGSGISATNATTGPSIYGFGGVSSGLPNSYRASLIDVGSTSYPYSYAIRTSKQKLLDEIDMPLPRYGNRSSPCSPVPPNAWGLDDFTDGMSTSLLHTQRGLALGALDLETRTHSFNGASEPQVDMLDIPGKGRCCVFIAKFPYDPPEEAEGELTLCAGDYLLVWTSGEPQGGYLDAELLDGRRGLIPASYVHRLIGDDLLEFHQAVLSTLRDAEDGSVQCDTTSLPSLPQNNPLLIHTHEDLARLCDTHTDLDQEQNDENSDTVPPPKHLTLERQLNKSVLIGWSPAEPVGYNNIENYHIYVDGVLKVTVKTNERTKALLEGVDSTRPHRISIRSVTQNRQTSRDAACTMIIGRDTSHLGPSAVRANNITCSSAIISWLPANSNHQHIVCVNNVEVRTVKPGVYRHTITGLAPSTQYRVTVRAKHLRAAGQTPSRPSEEAPGAYADFRTLTKGLPDPPQDIQLEAGPQDGTILVTWQPVNRPSLSGPVTGYAVYADGKKVTDISSPTGDHALIDISKLLGLNPRAVTIRTKSRESQSADSVPILIPNVVRNNASRRGQNQMGIDSQGPRRGGPVGINEQHQAMKQDENLLDQVHPQQEQGIQPSTTQGNMIQAKPQNPQNIGPTQQKYGQGIIRTRLGNQRGPTPGQGSGITGPRASYQQQQQQIQQQQQQTQPLQQMHQHPQQKKPRFFVAMFDYDPSTMSPNPDGCDEELPFQEGDTIKVYGDKDADGFYWGELRGRRGYVPHNMVTEVDDNQMGIQGATSGQGTASAPVPTQPSMRNISRDRWGDIYANMPVKRMIALYDYDPQELSPNVDAEQVELSFKTGEVILVYGEMDEDGFYMGELDGVRGLVPSNFLAEASEQYNNQLVSGGPNGNQRNLNNRGRGQGPGARGPPPPPRDNMTAGAAVKRGPQRVKDARPASPTQLDNTGHQALDHQTQGTIGRGGSSSMQNQFGQHQQSGVQPQQFELQQAGQMLQQTGQQQMAPQQIGQQHLSQQQQPPPPVTQASGGLFSGATSLLSGATSAATGGLFGSKQPPKSDQVNLPSGAQPLQQQTTGFGGLFGGGNQQQQQSNQQQQQQQQQINPQSQQPQQQQQTSAQQGQTQGQGPGFMSNIKGIATPGGEILSKGKDLFFGKFGFGK